MIRAASGCFVRCESVNNLARCKTPSRSAGKPPSVKIVARRLSTILRREPGGVVPWRVRCHLQEQELYALVGYIILNGESWYLRSLRLWMVVTSKSFLGGLKLRRYAPLQPSHHSYFPSLPPDDPAQPRLSSQRPPNFYCYFRPKFFSSDP